MAVCMCLVIGIEVLYRVLKKILVIYKIERPIFLSRMGESVIREIVP